MKYTVKNASFVNKARSYEQN